MALVVLLRKPSITAGQDQTQSGFPKFVTENGWLREEIWTGSDTIRASRIRYRKWLAEGGFSITNLENLDRIRHDQDWLAEVGFSVTNLGK